MVLAFLFPALLAFLTYAVLEVVRVPAVIRTQEGYVQS